MSTPNISITGGTLNRCPASTHKGPLTDTLDAVATRLRPSGPDGARQEAVYTVSVLMVVARLATEDVAFGAVLDEAVTDLDGSAPATTFHHWLWSGVLDAVDGGLNALDDSVTVSPDLGTAPLHCLIRLPDVWDDLTVDDVRTVLTTLRGQAWSGERMASELTDAMADAYRTANAGHYITPPSLARTMLALIPDNDLPGLALPGNSMALCLPDVPRSFKWIDTSVTDIRLADLVVRLYFLDGRQGSVHLTAPGTLPDELPGQAFVANPPFGERLRRSSVGGAGWPEAVKRPEALRSEAVALVSIAARRVPAAICVPAGFLFQGSETARVRQWLVTTQRLAGVIEFPAGMFPGTAFACAIVVLGPPGAYRGNPRLLDATPFVRRTGRRDIVVDDPAALARAFGGGERPGATPAAPAEPTLAELDDADFALTFARYAKSPLAALLGDRPTVRLDELVAITRPPPLPKLDREEPDAAIEYREATLHDFQDDGRLAPAGASRAHVTGKGNARRIEAMALAEGDILLASKSTVGKVALVGPDVHGCSIPGQTMVRLRLREQSPVQDPVVLLRYLSMPAVREHLEARAGGSAIKALKAKGIAELPVPVFDEPELERLRQTDRDIVSTLAEVARLRRRVDEMTARAVLPWCEPDPSRVGHAAGDNE